MIRRFMPSDTDIEMGTAMELDPRFTEFTTVITDLNGGEGIIIHCPESNCEYVRYWTPVELRGVPKEMVLSLANLVFVEIIEEHPTHWCSRCGYPHGRALGCIDLKEST